MVQLNQLADALVLEMFMDSGGCHFDNGQAYVKDAPKDIMEPLIISINQVTTTDEFLFMWEHGIIDVEFASTPYDDWLAEHGNKLTTEQLAVSLRLSNVLDTIFEPY